ncbi:MAG: hypothetical protein K0S33_4284 [Bacteroidetes bacterium]|jgi:hypothetical protein|nr:hypothetical protein [Bacteroidota bacterium]
MYRIFFFLLLFSCFGAVAQGYENSSCFDVMYGYKMYHQKFGKAFNTLGDFSFQKPVRIIGVKETAGLEKGDGVAEFYLAGIIPTAIRVQDSVPAKVTGLIFGSAGNIDLFKKSEIFDLFFKMGFNLSCIRLYGSQELNQKNFSFAPKLGIEPRINLGRLVFSASAEYDYDLTKPRWKRAWFTGKDKMPLQKFWQSGLTTSVSIGIRVAG